MEVWELRSNPKMLKQFWNLYSESYIWVYSFSTVDSSIENSLNQLQFQVSSFICHIHDYTEIV